MTPAQLLQFMRSHRLAVEASVSPASGAQAAVVGIAITNDFEVIFDTVETTRKARNLRQNPRIAIVIGGWLQGEERTVQYEGIADEPHGRELERIQQAYFDIWPDGRIRQTWPGLIYIRARPTWIRYSDYNRDPAEIVEFDAKALSGSV
jgi:uncharacterized protein YhbP (UPF0306 family)